MAELVDAADSKSVFARSGSSSLPRGTKQQQLQVSYRTCSTEKPAPEPVFLCLTIYPCLPLSAVPPSSLYPQLNPPIKFKQDSHCCAAAPSSAPAPCSESLIDSTIGGLCCLFITDHRDEAELRYPRTRASRRFSSHKSRALRTLNAVRSERDRINICRP